MEPEKVKEKVFELWPPDKGGCVCITGGEPFMQAELKELVELLMGHYEVSIETNGSLPIKAIAAPSSSHLTYHRLPISSYTESAQENYVRIIIDFKTPSSGMAQWNRYDNVRWLNRNLDEIKFVIADRDDYEFARDIIYTMDLAGYEILMSPAFESRDLSPNMALARSLANWILHDKLPVRLQLQLHKIIWPEKTKGV